MTKARDIADNAGQGGGGGQNVVINGQFEISQRGTSFTNIGSGGGGTSGYDDTWTMDRFLISQGQSAGRCSVEQSSDTPDGFSKSLKISTTTADTSIGGAEYHRLQTKFEGQNLQRFAKGTSGAKEFTLVFTVKQMQMLHMQLSCSTQITLGQYQKHFLLLQIGQELLLLFQPIQLVHLIMITT